MTGGRRRDLVAILDYRGGIVLLAAEGARTFAPAAQFAYATGYGQIVGADLDGDLREEIIVATGTSLVVFRAACVP